MALLADIKNINRVVEQINQGGYDIRPQQFYDRVLLDTIKLGEENYVHTKYTESYSLPVGTEKLQKRRWGGLTAHTVPLLEGIPPIADKTSMEEITFTATQFGRYMEFTDRVDLDQIDPQIAHYTHELGDVMARTFEKYARETLLSAASALYGGNKASEDELILGDKVTIADLRFLALRFDRLLVKPLADGMFVYITSPETLYDLLDDPLVINYMKINNTTRELYENGQPFSLFRIKFVQTMLDESYGDLGNPGEFYDGAWKVRAFAIKDNGDIVFATFPTASRSTNNEDVYLSDGTAIPAGHKVEWDLTANHPDNGTLLEADGTVNENYTLTTEDKALMWSQLPIHRGILMGKDAMARIAIDGAGGVETIIKRLGSAGSNDPLNQRQTIGVKAKSIGFGIIRDEALCITYGVPTAAIATTNLTTDAYTRAKHTDDTADATDNLTPYNVDNEKVKKPITNKPKEPKIE